jgi:AbrB family looped-hinge helix DNA binding protein
VVETTRLSSRGQVILPKSVREARHWRAGTEFLVESIEEGDPFETFMPAPAAGRPAQEAVIRVRYWSGWWTGSRQFV